VDDLLMLVHRIPYPPNKGDKIRSYHLLKHVAQRYRVHLATFVDDADDWQHVPRVQALCASSHFAKLDPVRARVRSLGALLTNRSLSLDYYRDAGLRDYVTRAVREHGIKRILVFSSAMAQYAEPYPDACRVIDYVDVDSDKWRQYAEKKRWPMSALYAHEARQLLAYERKVAATSDAALFVSAPEAALFRQLAPESAARIGHFSNGVDTDYFAPDAAFASPYAAGALPLVFCGAMDYWPNVDAVTWFAREIFPHVLARHPGAVFAIVGARPTPEVQALASLPGVIVTGTVPDVRPYVHHAALCVAPLRVARGIQNKVLEAMAMAQTVLVTPQALEGIAATPGHDLLLALDADALAAAAIDALAAPQPAMGARARACVLAGYAWSSHLAKIDSLLDTPNATLRNRA
jgi:sugar transferase (PEP-CTERM/EpsH1 system associated)